LRKNAGCAFGLFLLLSLAACAQDSKSPAVVAEPFPNVEGSVLFDIKPVNERPQELSATYSSGGKTARFRLELGPAKPIKEDKYLVSSGSGKFIRDPNSSPEKFLADLAKALEAKKLPKKVQKAEMLPFDYVILARNQTRSSDGGFSATPKGDWIAMKIFLSGDQGEVFLNLNPVLGKAEFSIKDSAYGDFVVAQLATVF
jgi:hypothetical protein